MTTQRLLVTGGLGFIGSHFIQNLFSHFPNTYILNIDALTYAGNLWHCAAIHPQYHYQWLQIDIRHPQRIHQAIMQFKPDAIIHFAAQSHVDRSIAAPSDFIDTNIHGTFNLLQSAHTYWQHLSASAQEHFRFIHISTDEVFGALQVNEAAFTEKSPYAPSSPYAASKAAADHIVQSYYKTYGLPCIITHCTNNYGPHQHTEKLIPHMIACALQHKPLPIYGDGSHIRDWLYVKDHCEALISILNHGKPGESYNIGGNHELTNLQVVHQLCHILDTLAPRSDHQSYHTHIRFVEDRLGHDRRYALDCKKIAQELGWQAVESFESGLRKTVQSYLAMLK